MQFRALVTLPAAREIRAPSACPVCGCADPVDRLKVTARRGGVGTLGDLLLPGAGGTGEAVELPCCSRCSARVAATRRTTAAIGWSGLLAVGAVIALVPPPLGLPLLAWFPLLLPLAWGPLLWRRYRHAPAVTLRARGTAGDLHATNREYARALAAANGVEPAIRRVFPLDLGRHQWIGLTTVLFLIALGGGAIGVHLEGPTLAGAERLHVAVSLLVVGLVLFRPLRVRRSRTWMKPDAQVFHQVRVDRHRIADHRPPPRR